MYIKTHRKPEGGGLDDRGGLHFPICLGIVIIPELHQNYLRLLHHTSPQVHICGTSLPCMWQSELPASQHRDDAAWFKASTPELRWLPRAKEATAESKNEPGLHRNYAWHVNAVRQRRGRPAHAMCGTDATSE